MKQMLLFFILVFALGSCTDDSGPNINEDLSHKLVGKWQSVSLKLEMRSYKNSDSLKMFEVPDGKWEEKMKICPIVTHYLLDGSYQAEHRSLKDSVIFKLAGKWMIVGDTLHLLDTFPSRGHIYKYKLKLHGNTVEFSGVEDCDADGKADDLYYGRLHKL